MDRETRAKFVSGYSKVLTQSWSDPAYREKLASSPTDVLTAEGIDVPAGVVVRLHTGIAGEGSLEDQVKLWEVGVSAGSVDLYVPDAPQMADGELSDTQLEAVAGGGDCCCCCCPCCTCT